MQVWRLFPERFRSTAFTGAGALYAAGRWNHLETAIVYTATSRALAALEFFVNLQPNEAPDDLLMAEATVPDACVEAFGPSLLPRNWRGLNNQRCRASWVRVGGESAVGGAEGSFGCSGRGLECAVEPEASRFRQGQNSALRSRSGTTSGCFAREANRVADACITSQTAPYSAASPSPLLLRDCAAAPVSQAG
jgi:hypothetical protein